MADESQIANAYINALRGLGPGHGDTPTRPATDIVTDLAKQKVGDLAGVMAAPGQALQSQVPMTSEDMVKPATDLAMQLGTSGMPMAEQGAAGIFGGRLSKTANLADLHDAMRLRDYSGFTPDEVLSSVGWFRHPVDGKWRYEIPDNKMSLNYMPTTEGDMALSTAGQLFNHPELFKAYPELKNANVYLTKDSSSPTGSGYHRGLIDGNRDISVSAPNAAVARSVALHELQHGVQDLEGFGYGGNPSSIARTIELGLRKNPKLYKGLNYMDVVGQADKLYRGLAGEVEARNVQKRADFAPDQRLLQGPWKTQEIPYEQQFTRSGENSDHIIRALRGK